MKEILLVNPWIYDFAAYDFWIKPIGLLSVGAVLRKHGYSIHLIDCLDRHHPNLLKGRYAPITKPDGTGKFNRHPIEKPKILRHVLRRYCRYGWPIEFFENYLKNCPEPAVILLTSGMTYWYPGVKETVVLLRKHFPNVPIVLGGTYATLVPNHAQQKIQPDFLVIGEGEEKARDLVTNILGNCKERFALDSLDDLPTPAFDLYPNLVSVPILTSRGCPFDCTFCASKQLTLRYRRRSPELVVDEIRHWYTHRAVRHFAFYDDALLVNKDRHIKPILDGIVRAGVSASFHTPNGLTPRAIDPELAELMKAAGFMTIRLSYETSNPSRQKEMHSKVTDEDLVSALDAFDTAGLPRHNIGVYVLIGLPNQSVEEIISSITFVISQGAKVHLASFSPIPGTREFIRAVELGQLSSDIDPLLTNNSIFPLHDDYVTVDVFEKIKLVTKHWNREIESKRLGVNKETVIQQFDQIFSGFKPK